MKSFWESLQSWDRDEWNVGRLSLDDDTGKTVEIVVEPLLFGQFYLAVYRDGELIADKVPGRPGGRSEAKQEGLQSEIVAWAAETFPQPNEIARAKGVWNHFNDEVDELVDALTGGGNVKEEAADVLHLLFQIADLGGFDLLEATREKFEVNKARTWGRPDPVTGVARHVEADHAE